MLMRFTRRTLRNGVAAIGIALTMATSLITPSAAGATSEAERASSAQGEVTTNAWSVRMTPVPANGRVSCYGYYGTFKTGTDVMVVDWETSSDECFGISTDRTIWHAWPNSGGWKRMPGNGHADYIYPLVVETSTKARVVMVSIPSAPRWRWCQNYTPSTNWTGDWYDCTP
jgi:hypothetical protein